MSYPKEFYSIVVESRKSKVEKFKGQQAIGRFLFGGVDDNLIP
jgi:hypothetical protein